LLPLIEPRSGIRSNTTASIVAKLRTSVVVLKLEMVVDAITALSAANVGRLVQTLLVFPVRRYKALKPTQACVLHKKKYRGWKNRGW
jgi:hypothetical protein